MRDRRKYLTLFVLILVALAGALMLEVPGSPLHRNATLGLDLRGGFEIVLQAEPPKGHKLTPADLDRSVSIMRTRIDKIGVSGAEIRKQEPSQIVIQIPGIHNFAQASKLVGQRRSSSSTTSSGICIARRSMLRGPRSPSRRGTTCSRRSRAWRGRAARPLSSSSSARRRS